MQLRCLLCVPAPVVLGLLIYELRRRTPLDLASPCAARQRGRVGEAQGSSGGLWPSSMGIPGNYGNSRHEGPKNITEAFAWSWAAPTGRFTTPGNGGTVVDDEKNVYLGANHRIVKFSPDGKILWEYVPEMHCDIPLPLFMMNSPSLWGDALFSATEAGSVFAVSKATGKEIWSRQYLGSDILYNKFTSGFVNNGFVQVSPDGVVVVDGVYNVYGFRALDGEQLWSFAPDGFVWNFKADFPGDGTFLFQTWEGEAYRNRLHDGSLVWKAGGQHGTWTDGNIALGPNNIVYAVSTLWKRPEPQPTRFVPELAFHGVGGQLSAYALDDGKRLWTYEFDKPPNNAPAIGRLGPGTGYSVIQPVGQQDKQWEKFWVYALDAQTGRLQWIFDGPTQRGPRQASDDLSPDQLAALQVQCVPNPWSAPTIDSAGTVYIANQEGPIYALRDANGDGKVSGPAEVDSYNTSRAFCGSEAPSIVPGLMAIASCDKMFVFRYPE